MAAPSNSCRFLPNARPSTSGTITPIALSSQKNLAGGPKSDYPKGLPGHFNTMKSMASTTGTEIRMNDFLAEELPLRRQMLAAVDEVLHSGRYILGKEVEAFEREWANLCETQFCVGVGN